MCECYDTMAKRFKAKKGFEIKSVLRLHYVSPHLFCVLRKRVKRSVLFCRSCVLYNSCVRLCANIFGVGPESDGEALTDRKSRPWGKTL